MTFYQAIFAEDMYGTELNDDYTKKYLSGKHSKRSLIFLYDSFIKDVTVLDENDEILIDGRTINVPFKKFNYIINESVNDELGEILNFKHHTNLADTEKHERIEENRRFVVKFHGIVKKLISQLTPKDYS